MAKLPKNNRKPWSDSEKVTLKRLAAQNTPTRVIGLKMGRTPSAVASQAARQRVSLKPTNQSPYGTKGKKK